MSDLWTEATRDERDLWVCEAHSLEEANGKASTQTIAKALDEPARRVAAHMRGMQERLLTISHWPEHDKTVDWTLTPIGVDHAESIKADLGSGASFFRWASSSSPSSERSS